MCLFFPWVVVFINVFGFSFRSWLVFMGFQMEVVGGFGGWMGFWFPSWGVVSWEFSNGIKEARRIFGWVLEG